MDLGLKGQRMSQVLQSASMHDLLDSAERTGRYSTFLSAVKLAGLEATLRSKGPFTLFAPQDEAFEKFPSATLDKLMAPDNRDLLVSVLGYHFAPGQVLAARFAGKRIAATSFEGSRLRIDGSDGLHVDGASVVEADVPASNGVLHGIDRVLWPKTAGAAVAVPAA